MVSVGTARAVMRLMGPGLLNDRVPLPVRRAGMRALGLLPMPGGARVIRRVQGGVPTRTIETATVRPDRTLLYLHGGGYVLGSSASHRSMVARLVVSSGLRAVLVDYRRAPRHRFPAAFQDVLRVHQSLVDDGVDPAAIVLAGDSAGGGLALAAALALRDADRAPAGLALICPWLDLTAQAAWRGAEPRDPALKPAHLAGFADAYLGGDESAAVDPRVSPLYADLAGLPPMVVHSAGDDPLGLEAGELVRRAEKASVPVEHREHPGMWHDFHVLAGLLAEADDAVAALAAAVRSF